MKFKGNLACVIFGTTVLLLVIFFFKHLHTLTYLHKRYIRKVDFSPNVRKLENIPTIPQHIHQMYFDVNGMDHFNQYEFARKSWLKCCSGCRYTLWNESMVDNFVKEQYPSLFNLYSNYQQWVLKIDLGKYAIVHYFGGIYADIDLECTKNITSLLLRIHSQRKQVLLHRGDFGTFTNDFFAGTAKHPLFEFILSGLFDANRSYILPYFNTMFTAGSTYFYGSIRNFGYKGEIADLPHHNTYIFHHFASTWYKWDAAIIAWFRRGGGLKKTLMFVICISIIVCYTNRRKRKMKLFTK